MANRAARQQFLHKKVDHCLARNDCGRLCARVIVRRVWTIYKAWNEARDDAHRPKRCCDCIAKEFESRRAA